MDPPLEPGGSGQDLEIQTSCVRADAQERTDSDTRPRRRHDE
jgi:hypothetical protein